MREGRKDGLEKWKRDKVRKRGRWKRRVGKGERKDKKGKESKGKGVGLPGGK